MSGNPNLDNTIQGWRILAFGLVVGLISLIYLGVLFNYQILESPEWVALAEEIRVSEINLQAQRGIILDRNGYTLARNIPAYNAVITPANLPDDPGEIQDVSSPGSLRPVVPSPVQARADAPDGLPVSLLPDDHREGGPHGLLLLFFQAVFLKVERLGAWTFDLVLLLFATFHIVDYIMSITFQRNLAFRLPERIPTGELDTRMVLPASLLFLASLEELDLMDFFSFLPAVAFLICVLDRIDFAFTWTQPFAYCVLLKNAVVFVFSFRSTAPAVTLLETGFRQAIEDGYGTPVDLHVEHLDLPEAVDAPYGDRLAELDQRTSIETTDGPRIPEEAYGGTKATAHSASRVCHRPARRNQRRCPHH